MAHSGDPDRSDKWGYATSEPSGKTVWARISLSSPRQ